MKNMFFCIKLENEDMAEAVCIRLVKLGYDFGLGENTIPSIDIKKTTHIIFGKTPYVWAYDGDKTVGLSRLDFFKRFVGSTHPDDVDVEELIITLNDLYYGDKYAQIFAWRCEDEDYPSLELKKAADPLIKYLNDNHHPHVSVIVTPTSVELLTSKMSIPKIFDYVKD